MQLLEDRELLKFTGMQESQYFIKPDEVTEKVKDRIDGVGFAKGDLLPWQKTHAKVALRPGEISLWAGISGHGKSQLLGQVCAWNLKYKKWLIASMEMLPAATLARMAQQCAGCKPSHNYLDILLKWMDNRLWLYDQTNTVKTERILAMIYYAATELEIDHIIIDSMMKCGIKHDDFDGQAFFVDKLCWAAKTTGCHIHLVHHMRKGDKESNIPDKFDIRGASQISDLVDNIFIVHRNKAKEVKLRSGGTVDKDQQDCSLIVTKQRHGEYEGLFKLWFLPESKQYVPNPDNRVMAYHI
jgi:twinkle protein